MMFIWQTYIWWYHTVLLIDWTSVASRWHHRRGVCLCRPEADVVDSGFLQRCALTRLSLGLSALAHTETQAGRRTHKRRGKAADWKKIWNLEDGRQTGSNGVIYSPRHKQSQIKGLFPPHAQTNTHKHNTHTDNAALEWAESQKKLLKWETFMPQNKRCTMQHKNLLPS